MNFTSNVRNILRKCTYPIISFSFFSINGTKIKKKNLQKRNKENKTNRLQNLTWTKTSKNMIITDTFIIKWDIIRVTKVMKISLLRDNNRGIKSFSFGGGYSYNRKTWFAGGYNWINKVKRMS